MEYTTKITSVGRSGNGRMILLPKNEEFKLGDIVKVTITLVTREVGTQVPAQTQETTPQVS